MTDAPTCDRCGRRIADTAYVCADCARDLRRDLEAVAVVAGEVVTTIARLDHIGERDGQGPPAGDPEARADNALFPMALPVNLDAGVQHDAAVTALTTWARHVHESSGRPLPVVGLRPASPPIPLRPAESHAEGRMAVSGGAQPSRGPQGLHGPLRASGGST